MRPFIDNKCSRLVLCEGHETLDALEVTVVWCLVSVCPYVVGLACATRYPAAAIEAGNELIGAPDFTEWRLDCGASADKPSVLLVSYFAELEDAMGVNGVVKFLDLRDAVNPLVKVALRGVNLVGRQHIFDDGVAVGFEFCSDRHFICGVERNAFLFITKKVFNF